jgi:hypothetical protein
MFEKYSIRTVFDAPCGDFNWMRQVVAENRIRYVGGDIVPALVRINQSDHGDSQTNFINFNLTCDRFPEADLWLCRDCLFHLCYREIHKALGNFTQSGVRFVLLPNHRGSAAFENHDIRTGGFRKLNLQAPPFNFPHEIRQRIQEGPAPDSDHEMCLWTREQISSALPAMELALQAIEGAHAN